MTTLRTISLKTELRDMQPISSEPKPQQHQKSASRMPDMYRSDRILSIKAEEWVPS